MNTPNNLVKLLDLDDDFIIDLKYATEDNFAKKKVYSSGECYLDKHTAYMLIEVKEILKKDGYRVKVWDAYRPISAQEKFFEIVKDDNFVAMPPDLNTIKEFKASHMNGLCVDITLTDMAGNELVMPTEFDDFSEMAGLGCDKIGVDARENAEYLKSIMESVGFEPLSSEWWHFYDRKTVPTSYLDIQI